MLRVVKAVTGRLNEGMTDDVHNAKGGVAKWFLKKFFTSPATWLGILAGGAVGNAFINASGVVSGGIGMGAMVGIAVGMIVFTVLMSIRLAHKNATKLFGDGGVESHEQSVLANLRDASQTEDAELLEKMLRDRDAVLKRCRGLEGESDATHTADLVSAIVSESCLQLEELQDLVRRAADPMLDAPGDVAEKIEAARANLRRAYQAVADARSRLRRGERACEIDLLSGSNSPARLDLASLSNQLEEETAISKRVEDRMRPDFESSIVADEPVESSEAGLRELE